MSTFLGKTAWTPVIAATVGLVGCSQPDVAEGPIIQATFAAVQTHAAPRTDSIAAGEQLMAAGDYRRAVDEFTRALTATGLEQRPLSVFEQGADLYYQRGLAYLGMGFPDTAAADLNEAIKLAPHHGDAYEARGRAYLALGDSFKALRDLTQAVRLNAANAGAYHARGEAYLRRGQYDRAVADLEQAGREDPALIEATRQLLSEAYLRWSQDLAEDGDQVIAAEKLTKARELNAAFVDQQGQVAAAAASPVAVEQTVAKPVLAEADELFAAGREQQQAGRFDQALISFTRAIALRANFADAYLRRGETLLAMGFPDTAVEDLKRASNRDASAEALRLQAQAFLQLGSPHRATLAATEALHADPTQANGYALRGQAYLALENWQRCINDLEEATRRDPTLSSQLEPFLGEARRRQELFRQQEIQSRREADQEEMHRDSAAQAPVDGER